jgi:hypothetical protein
MQALKQLKESTFILRFYTDTIVSKRKNYTPIFLQAINADTGLAATKLQSITNQILADMHHLLAITEYFLVVEGTTNHDHSLLPPDWFG